MLSRQQKYLFLLLAGFGSYFAVLFGYLMKTEENNIMVNHPHVWGDWSLHVTMSNIFSYKDPSEWLAYHPYFAGGKFTYGFLTNMISGLLIRFNVPYYLAFSLPSLFYALALIVGLYFMFLLITKKEKTSFIAVTLFFLSSGPGFIKHFQTWFSNPSWQTLLYPPKDISRLEEYQWLAGNVINGILLPQRAYLLGMTVAVWSLVLLLTGLKKLVYLSKNSDKQLPSSYLSTKHLFLAGGMLAGILPITHMHSLMALVVIAGFVCRSQWRRWQELAWYVIPAGVLSGTLFLLFVNGGIENPDFMQLHLGWTAAEGVLNWLKMWSSIWGLIMVVALIGLVKLPKKDPIQRDFFIASWLIFLLGNIIMFQPVHWDNSKLFFWSYLGFSGLAAVVITQLVQKNTVGKVLGVGLWLALSMTGIIELHRLQLYDINSLTFATHQDMELGAIIREQTPPLAVFATYTSHNHPISMWGTRSIVLGYTTWAWNFGFVIEERNRDLATLFKGTFSTPDLLKKYNVDYVVIGPNERTNYDANENYFAARYPLVISYENYHIYQVRDQVEK